MVGKRNLLSYVRFSIAARYVPEATNDLVASGSSVAMILASKNQGLTLPTLSRNPTGSVCHTDATRLTCVVETDRD